MPLDPTFHDKIAPLYEPGFGTETVGPLLHALVRMTRPRRVLEVGLGYTSPFIAMALKDNVEEAERDRALLAAGVPGAEPDPADRDDQRRSILDPAAGEAGTPRLHVIDDFSTAGTTAPKVMEVLGALDLDFAVTQHRGDFRGYSRRLDRDALPFDFVWFDCGASPEYVDFLTEYWPLINPHHGLLLLHFTYWFLSMDQGGQTVGRLISGPIANALKRQQAKDGFDARFEVLSLVEPHKRHQGSVTMVRKLPPESVARDSDFEEEMNEIFGRAPDPFPRLD